MNKSTLFLMSLIFAITNTVNCDEIPKLTQRGLTFSSLSNYEEQITGKSAQIGLRRLSPDDLFELISDIKSKVQEEVENCGFAKCTVMEILGIDDLPDQINPEMYTDFINGAWGMVLANGGNNPTGPQNMLVVVDDRTKRLVAVDFANPAQIQFSQSERNALSLFGINADIVSFPEVYQFGSNISLGEGSQRLKNPKGIATDKAGNFWVADASNNRVIRFTFVPSTKSFELKGILAGLSHPTDVAYLPADGSLEAKLGVANHSGNNIILIEPNFSDEIYALGSSVSGKKVHKSVGGVQLVKPYSISANYSEKKFFYITHSLNEILKIERTNENDIVLEKQKNWPIDEGIITSIKTNSTGEVFVVDNRTSYIGKFTSELDLLFISGGFDFAHQPTRMGENLGFNKPKYMALSDNGDIFVSERWFRYGGIQTFKSWPRFIENTVSMQIGCSDEENLCGCQTPDKIWFMFESTNSGTVKIEVTKAGDDGYSYSLSEAVKAGWNAISVFKTEFDPGGFDSNIEYYAELKLYDASSSTNVTDQSIYTLDQQAPGFLPGFASIASELFNPDISSPTALFNLTQGAKVTFKVSENPGVSPWIYLKNGTKEYTRLETGVHEVLLDVTGLSLQEIPKNYQLYAELQSLPCADKAVDIKYPLPNILKIDKTAPTITFPAFTEEGFNPDMLGAEEFDFSYRVQDNSNSIVKYRINVFDKSTNDFIAVAENVPVHPVDGSQSSGDWNGVLPSGEIADEGEYYLKTSIYDIAGNHVQSSTTSTFFLDKTPPFIQVDAQASSYSTKLISGKNALLLTQGRDLTLNLSVSDVLPDKVHFRLKEVDPNDLTKVISTVDFPPVQYSNGWPSNVTLSNSHIQNDGLYSIYIYGVDKIGNTNDENTVLKSISLDDGSSIEYILVNRLPPELHVIVMPPTLKSGETGNLIIHAYPKGSFESASYSYPYTINLTSENYGPLSFTPPAGTPSVLTYLEPDVEIPFNTNDFPGKIGKFTFTVTVNEGNGGAPFQQSADVWVDVFPPKLAGGNGKTVPQKFFLTGQVGDPDLSNPQNKHGFEFYEIYYKQNHDPNTLPTDLTGWVNDNVFVPVHTIDRNGPSRTVFPEASRADNKEAPTQSWGNTVLGYINGMALTEGGSYTFMLLAKEKGIGTQAAPIINSSTAFLKQVTIGNNSLYYPRITNLTLDGSSVQNVTFNANGSNSLTIVGEISTQNGPSESKVTLYIYPKDEKTTVVDPISVRKEIKTVKTGDSFSFSWDGKDDKLAFVKNGKYQIAIFAEETESNPTEGGYNHDILNADITVTTPLHFLEGHMNEDPISSLPALTDPPGNTATFQYRLSKAGQVYLRVTDKSNTSITFDVGPETNFGGIGVSHYITWDAINTKTGTPVALGEYIVQPFVVDIDPNITTEVLFEKSYTIKVIKQNEETEYAGEFVGEKHLVGYSDLLWRTKPSASKISYKQAQLTSSDVVNLKVRGTQSVKRHSFVSFGGIVSRKQTLMDFKIKARHGIKRLRKPWCPFGCSWRSCMNDPGAVNDWVFRTHIWNKSNFQIKSSQHYVVSPVIDYTTPFWFQLGWEGVGEWDGQGTPPTDDDYWHCHDGADGNDIGRIHGTANQWVAIYDRDDNLVEVMWVGTRNINDQVPSPGTPSQNPLVFNMTDEKMWSTISDGNTDVNVTFIYNTVGNGFNKLITLAPIDLYRPGQEVFGGKDDHNGGWGALTNLINTDGFKLIITPVLPDHGILILNNIHFNGSRLSIPKNAMFEGNPYNLEHVNIYFNSGVVYAQRVYKNATGTYYTGGSNPPLHVSFVDNQGNLDPKGKLLMPIDYSYKLASTAPPGTYLVNDAPYPFPTVSNSGITYTLNGANVDVVHPDQPWSLIQASPMLYDALYANSLDNISIEIPINLNLSGVSKLGPGESAVISLNTSILPNSGLDKNNNPIGLNINSFSFATTNNKNLNSFTTKNGVNLDLSINADGTELTIFYPPVPIQGTDAPWNPQTDDPVLSQNNGNFQGYLKVGNDVVNNYANPDKFEQVTGFPSPTFVYRSQDINVINAYKKQADNYAISLPPFNETFANNAWYTHPQHWATAGWKSDISGTNINFHWNSLNMEAKGLRLSTQTPFSAIELFYIDGTTPSDDLVPNSINISNNKFTPNLSALATPQRFFPIAFSFGQGINNISNISLKYYEIGKENASWVPITNLKTTSFVRVGNEITEEEVERIIAFWNVTGLAGRFYIRINGTKTDGNIIQRTMTVGIGTNVEKNTPIIVKSAYKKVELSFGVGSDYEGLVTLDPLKPEDINAFGNVPKGLIVEVSPSKLIFKESNEPNLMFYLTRADIIDLIGSSDLIGQIGVYYLNEETFELERAQFSADIVNIADIPSSPTAPPPPSQATVANATTTYTFNANTQVLMLRAPISHTSKYGAISSFNFVVIDQPYSKTNETVLPLLTGKISTSSFGQLKIYRSESGNWSGGTSVELTGVIPGSENPTSGIKEWSIQNIQLEWSENYIYACIGPCSEQNSSMTKVKIMKDTDIPTVNSAVVRSGYVNHTDPAVQVDVVLSEAGNIGLYIPKLTDKLFDGISEHDDQVVSITVPLVKEDNSLPLEGEYKIHVNANDEVGNNLINSRTISFFVDITDPELTIYSSSIYRGITGVLTDNMLVDKVEVNIQVNGQEYVECIQLNPSSRETFVSQLNFEDMVEGPGVLTIKGYDKAKNSTVYGPITIEIQHQITSTSIDMGVTRQTDFCQ